MTEAATEADTAVLLADYPEPHFGLCKNFLRRASGGRIQHVFDLAHQTNPVRWVFEDGNLVNLVIYEKTNDGGWMPSRNKSPARVKELLRSYKL